MKLQFAFAEGSGSVVADEGFVFVFLWQPKFLTWFLHSQSCCNAAFSSRILVVWHNFQEVAGPRGLNRSIREAKVILLAFARHYGSRRHEQLIWFLGWRLYLWRNAQPLLLGEIKNMSIIQFFGYFLDSTVHYHALAFINNYRLVYACRMSASRSWLINFIILNFCPLKSCHIQFPKIVQFLFIALFSGKDVHEVSILIHLQNCGVPSSWTWPWSFSEFDFFPSVSFKSIFEHLICP